MHAVVLVCMWGPMDGGSGGSEDRAGLETQDGEWAEDRGALRDMQTGVS